LELYRTIENKAYDITTQPNTNQDFHIQLQINTTQYNVRKGNTKMNQKSCNISLRLDTNTHNVLHALAKKEDATLSQIIRRHLKNDLKRLGLLEEEVAVKAPRVDADLKLPEDWED
jgi:hypothetical protein